MCYITYYGTNRILYRLPIVSDGLLRREEKTAQLFLVPVLLSEGGAIINRVV